MDHCMIIIYVPTTHADSIREALGKAGAGKIGNYSHCSFSSRGTGRFLPNKKANPTIGKEGSLEEVEEERIEVIAPKELLSSILENVRRVHPYEEPAIHVLPLIEP